MTAEQTTEKPNIGALLKTGFERLLTAEFGSSIAPPSYVTPTGTKALDAILGGGLGSSLPLMISATPETGKSTCAFQWAKRFQDLYPDSVVVYLDVEGASEVAEENSRTSTFNIDMSRFMYMPAVLNIKQVFECIVRMADVKHQFEEKTQREFKVMVIWDSLASTPSSKDADVDDHNSVIGFRARELTHQLNHNKSLLVMSKITLVIVDQVRSDIQITSRFAPAVEKSAGQFGGGWKSASNVAALSHNIKQWIFCSKGKDLYPATDMGVDGWEINIHTEKNKIAPSHVSIKCVFDKKFGILPTHSDYIFMRDMTKTEIKRTKNDAKKLTFPLAVSVDGRSKIITVYDVNTNKPIERTEKFTEKNMFSLYQNNAEFKRIFDRAMDHSVTARIKMALFRELGDNQISKELVDETVSETQPAEVQPAETQQVEAQSGTIQAEDGTVVNAETGEIQDEYSPNDMPPL